jgi:hypothetical protein
MSFFRLAIAILFSILSLGNAASVFAPARPPALPLAVKSPYLSTWLNAGSDGGNGGYLTGQWPTHWRWVAWMWLYNFTSNKMQWPNYGLVRIDSCRWTDFPVDGKSGSKRAQC